MDNVSKSSPFKCAIVYDFDGTLADGDCAQHGLLPAMGYPKAIEFWNQVKSRSKDSDGDEILTYICMLLEQAKQRGIDKLGKNKLREFGSHIPLFDGVKEWFNHINQWVIDHNIQVEHYIISSGLYEMIKGTEIAKHFQNIFACKYFYNNEVAIWPSVTINYTTKTQYLFRINKGINNCWDNDSINRYVPENERPIPFTRMIYIGDGDTDIPSMKMVNYQGGKSIAVFNKSKWQEQNTQEKIENLISENRASYVVPADYTKGSQLDVTVRGILKLYSREKRL